MGNPSVMSASVEVGKGAVYLPAISHSSIHESLHAKNQKLLPLGQVLPQCPTLGTSYKVL